MAQAVDTNYGSKFNLPIPIGRLNPVPNDSTEVWPTLTSAQEYAQSGATAYVGQLIYVQENGKHYFIKNTSGELAEVGTDGSGSTNIIYGYYSAASGKFFTDSTYLVEIVGDPKNFYLDMNSGDTTHPEQGCKLFYFNNEEQKFICTTKTATEYVAGLVKLYTTHGQNEDGTMTQKCITDGVNSIKFALETSEDEDGDGEQENILVLDLPWD